jgi:hypothetical protein
MIHRIKRNMEESTLSIRRERKTIEVMIRIYCQGKHGTKGRFFINNLQLCSECECMYNYACQRLETCPIRIDKPTCQNCTIHCYKPDMKEHIRKVMGYAGPRMFYRHPILSLFHFFNSKMNPKMQGVTLP